MTDWQRALVVSLIGALAVLGLNTWMGRPYYSAHPRGRPGYLADSALGAVSFFAIMSGMMIILNQDLGWVRYLAAVAWAVAVVTASQVLPTFRKAQTRLIQTRLSSQ